MNTIVTYLLYLLLLNFFSFRISYALAYFSGVLIAFAANRYFVFNTHRGIRSVLLFPLVCVVQFLLGLAIVQIWVDMLGYAEKLAPLVAVVLIIPVTYVLSKAVFGRQAG